MQYSVSPTMLPNCTDEEWQARVDLAAAHRLAYRQGFNEGIFNHLTFVVPGRDDRYFQIPFGMHWSEVTDYSPSEDFWNINRRDAVHKTRRLELVHTQPDPQRLD